MDRNMLNINRQHIDAIFCVDASDDSQSDSESSDGPDESSEESEHLSS